MNLFQSIDAMLSEIFHGWCSPEKAQAVASAVVALRPEVSVDIGIFAGKSLCTFGLAHKLIGVGRVIGIDPFDNQAAIEGQQNEADRNWWFKVPMESIYKMAQENVSKFGVSEFARIERLTSDAFDVLPYSGKIGIISIDGNHGIQSIKDVEHYAPHIMVGGLAFLDDLKWTGNSVLEAVEKLKSLGFVERYVVNDKVTQNQWGCYQRIK